MKKLFTFLGVLLLWQTMAVAQNHLYVYHGDTCVTKAPIANLDSATVRQTEFYEPLYLCQGVFNESFFYSGAFEVSVYALGDKLIVKDATCMRVLLSPIIPAARTSLSKSREPTTTTPNME